AIGLLPQSGKPAVKLNTGCTEQQTLWRFQESRPAQTEPLITPQLCRQGLQQGVAILLAETGQRQDATALQAVGCRPQRLLDIFVSRHSRLEQGFLQLVALQTIEGKWLTVQLRLLFFIEKNFQPAGEETLHRITQE